MNKKSSHIKITRAGLLQAREDKLRQAQPFSLEPCGLIGGIHLINDSAAVNVEMVAETLMAFDEPVVWIMDSDIDLEGLSELKDLVKDRVKTIVAVGENTDEVHSVIWSSLGFFISASNWSESLACGLIAAKANDHILFSPGTRARDPFANFKERGAYFTRLVQNYTPPSP